MNKYGKTSVAVYIGIVLMLGILGVIAFGVYQGQVTLEEEIAIGDCETAPSITVAAVNAINRGTSVTVGEVAIINDQYVGSTPSTLRRGDEVELLLNASNYIDVKVAPFVLECGVKIVPADLYATDDAAFRIFNSNGDLVTDDAAGGATNQTASSAPMNLEIFIDSKVDESTGDLIIVVEASNTSQVDSLVLSGLGGASSTSVPEFYSVAAAGSIAKAFLVPAVKDGASVSGTLTISPESGITVDGTAIYVTAHSKQAFADTDGTFKVDVEDKDGTTKYEDEWDYDFLVT